MFCLLCTSYQVQNIIITMNKILNTWVNWYCFTWQSNRVCKVDFTAAPNFCSPLSSMYGKCTALSRTVNTPQDRRAAVYATFVLFAYSCVDDIVICKRFYKCTLIVIIVNFLNFHNSLAPIIQVTNLYSYCYTTVIIVPHNHT